MKKVSNLMICVSFLGKIVYHIENINKNRENHVNKCLQNVYNQKTMGHR